MTQTERRAGACRYAACVSEEGGGRYAQEGGVKMVRGEDLCFEWIYFLLGQNRVRQSGQVRNEPRVLLKHVLPLLSPHGVSTKTRRQRNAAGSNRAQCTTSSKRHTLSPRNVLKPRLRGVVGWRDSLKVVVVVANEDDCSHGDTTNNTVNSSGHVLA